MYFHHMGYFGWLWMVLFWAALIWFIFWLINKDNIKNSSMNQTPMNLIKTRYAKGEISKKEYEQIKKEIER